MALNRFQEGQLWQQTSAGNWNHLAKIAEDAEAWLQQTEPQQRKPKTIHENWFKAIIGNSEEDWTQTIGDHTLKAYKYVFQEAIWDRDATTGTGKYVIKPNGRNSFVSADPFGNPAINEAEPREMVADGAGGFFYGDGVSLNDLPQVSAIEIRPIAPMRVVDMCARRTSQGDVLYSFDRGPIVVPVCGKGTPTDPVPGACCDPATGECTDGVLCSECSGQCSPGQQCSSIVCPAPAGPGACCHPNGECTDGVMQGQCQSPDIWQGDGSLCANVQCPQPPDKTGACCLFDGKCFVLTADQCAINSGTYQGDGTPCTPNPCPQPPEEAGACCDNFGNCSEVPPGQCNGQFFGIGTTCGDLVGICEPKGACCPPDGLCSPNQTQTQCANNAGVWLGPGSGCAGNPCDNPHTGACCVDGQCFDMTPAACSAAGGTPVPGNCPVFCPGGV